jgi:hypothetical protein
MYPNPQGFDPQGRILAGLGLCEKCYGTAILNMGIIYEYLS